MGRDACPFPLLCLLSTPCTAHYGSDVGVGLHVGASGFTCGSNSHVGVVYYIARASI